MQILGNVFNIIIFLTIVGSLFTVGVLLIQIVFRIAIPLWLAIFTPILYLIPVVVPQVKLVSPEISLWLPSYQNASVVWAIGTVAFLMFYLLRVLFAYWAIRKYPACMDESINLIYKKCSKELGFKRLPKLCFGTLKEPACVVTLLRPVVILKPDIVGQLSDSELQIVLVHELVHIKRKHHLFQRIFDFVSILYWFNPLVWIVKKEFSFICEMDCDNQAIGSLSSQTTIKDYTDAILHLLELSAAQGSAVFGKINALGFLKVKKRFTNILQKPSKKKRTAMFVAIVLCIAVTVIASISASKAMFYPYPAFIYETQEYSSIHTE